MTRVAKTILTLVALQIGTSAQVPPPKAPPAAYQPAEGLGPYAVAEWTAEWEDAVRSRTVPVRIYFPEGAPGLLPMVVFSHGLGGSRDGYRYLGERWASRGYVSVHLQHPGSDGDLMKEPRPLLAVRRAAANPRNLVDRPKDVTFALDTLARLSGDTSFPLKGRLDWTRVGAAGHSFGAYTALAASGRRFARGGDAVSLGDPRVRACVALSSPSQGKERDCPAYRDIKVPCLHMTGTEDGSEEGGEEGRSGRLGRGAHPENLIGDTPAAFRRVPYDCISGVPEYLVTFEGGDHMVFSGRARKEPKPTDARFQQLTGMATTAFWDAYLKGDALARQWLDAGGFNRALGAAGTFEQKGTGAN